MPTMNDDDDEKSITVVMIIIHVVIKLYLFYKGIHVHITASAEKLMALLI